MRRTLRCLAAGSRRVAFVALAAAALPGCAVSLFSDHEASFEDEEDRIAVLERRMDEVERRLPPK